MARDLTVTVPSARLEVERDGDQIQWAIYEDDRLLTATRLTPAQAVTYGSRLLALGVDIADEIERRPA
jgi:hypothetical protein